MTRRFRFVAAVALLLMVLAPPLVLAGGGNEPAGPEPALTPNETPQSPGTDGGSMQGNGTATQERDLLEGVTFRPVLGFDTDWTRTVIEPTDVLSGGPPKDGIPAIDSPKFLEIEQVDWIGDQEAVFVVTAGGESRIYPLQILTFHEIVNDVVGGVPVAVTYCPLCNTGIAFLREFDGLTLDFGTTGRLRYSNLLMYDRQTESWWQQATGEGVIGQYAGFRLQLYPVLMLPYEVAAARYADALVLSRDTGHQRSYGRNPYVGYDTAAQPFLYQGPAVSSEFSPMARVVQVIVNDEARGVPYPIAREEGVIEFELSGLPVLVLWDDGTASGLDTSSTAAGRDVGSANAFDPRVDDRVLRFERTPEGFVDSQTGSTWDGSGTAIGGPLEGTSLEPLVGIQHFWFSYSAFETDGVFEPFGE